ncbi:hypothetical protein HPP92_013396 [Vanilla planifolia]|uniref:FRIGIDA-like protein n=1 Tax=Vanilla planifolia TaxID=51239 RepID=A0A835QNC3_VANPL|nr:hypothetical protein HPP92_013396 [Vanilla planifolia]
MDEPGCDNLVSSEINLRVNYKLAKLELDASNGYALEAQAFLQLLATFSISSGFDEDELCQLVVAMPRRCRQAPELCHALGLAHTVQGLINLSQDSDMNERIHKKFISFQEDGI